MDTKEALVEVIIKNPEDHFLRLALADLLEERGEITQATRLRTTLDRLPYNCRSWPEYVGIWADYTVRGMDSWKDKSQLPPDLYQKLVQSAKDAEEQRTMDGKWIEVADPMRVFLNMVLGE